MNFLKKFLLVLFPIHCVNCKKQDIHYLCNKCLNTIPYIHYSNNSHITSAFSYKNPIVKQAIWHLKFYGKQDIARILSEKAFDVLVDEIQDLNTIKTEEKIILIPIPLHLKRFRERGFNQSQLIAEALFQKNPSLFLVDTLSVTRNRYTQPQAKITHRKDRIKNISKCFSVTTNESIKHKTIIIIDDITTTGATIEELRKLLIEAGAKHVRGFTLAQ